MTPYKSFASIVLIVGLLIGIPNALAKEDASNLLKEITKIEKSLSFHDVAVEYVAVSKDIAPNSCVSCHTPLIGKSVIEHRYRLAESLRLSPKYDSDRVKYHMLC